MSPSTLRAAYWPAHLAVIDRTGVTVAEYGREHVLSASSLYVWRGRLQRDVAVPPARVTTTRFAEVTTTDRVPASSELCVRIGATTLEFDTLPDPAWLAALVRSTSEPR